MKAGTLGVPSGDNTFTSARNTSGVVVEVVRSQVLGPSVSLDHLSVEESEKDVTEGALFLAGVRGRWEIGQAHTVPSVWPSVVGAIRWLRLAAVWEGLRRATKNRSRSHASQSAIGNSSFREETRKTGQPKATQLSTVRGEDEWRLAKSFLLSDAIGGVGVSL